MRRSLFLTGSFAGLAAAALAGCESKSAAPFMPSRASAPSEHLRAQSWWSQSQDGYVTIVNGTPYDWQLTYQHSYQMDDWSFPSVIPRFSSANVHVRYHEGWFTTTTDDGAEATYTISGTNLSFQFQARVPNGNFDMRVVFGSLATQGNPQGSTIDLGWSGTMIFVLSGQLGRLTSTNPPSAWMQENLSAIGGMTLRQLCMPGSHDAGMSVIASGTAFSNSCNTQTQSLSVNGQLQRGSRFFDIRPVISAGQYMTGHYSFVSQLNSWQGGNGESIASIVNGVNAFTASNKELVILYLSHDLNTDVGNSSYRPFTQDEWNGLFAELHGIENLYVTSSADLTTLTLDSFISGGRAAVVLVVDPSDSGITLGGLAGRGFFTARQFPVYNSYADSNDLATMANDQFTKMAAQRPNPNAEMFLLSWTLTQNSTQAVLGTTCISGLASTADPQIYQMLLSHCSAQTYPNILYVDEFSDSNMAALAMAVNTLALS